MHTREGGKRLHVVSSDDEVAGDEGETRSRKRAATDHRSTPRSEGQVELPCVQGKQKVDSAAIGRSTGGAAATAAATTAVVADAPLSTPLAAGGGARRSKAGEGGDGAGGTGGRS